MASDKGRNGFSTDPSGLDFVRVPVREVGEYWYTVKEGDSLWRIAKEQLGKASAVAAIKELNKDVLAGADHDVVTVGMKLKLPAKPVASAAN